MSKSKRIQEIDGWFHGVHFTIKPTPINIRKVEEEINEMMRSWYSKNAPEVLEREITDGDIENASSEELADLTEHLNKMFMWMEDVEFRSSYLRKKAELAMDFEGSVPEDVWESDSLEYSTINEAWDFFCGRRQLP